MLLEKMMIGLLFLAANLATAGGTEPKDCSVGDKYYCVAGGEVDAETYNGFRRYHAACNHCHGPDGTLIGKVLIPETCSNLCFAGAKRNRLMICGTTSLYSVFLTCNGSANG